MLEKKKVVLLSYLIIVLAALVGSIYMIFNHDKLNKKEEQMILIVTEEFNNESKDTKYQVSSKTSFQINTLSKEKVFMEIIEYNNDGIKLSFDKDMAIVNSDKTINYDSKKKEYSLYLDSYLMIGIKDDLNDVVYKISYIKENNNAN